MVTSSNSLVIHNDGLHTGSAKRNGASGVKGVDAAGVLDGPIVMADIAAAIKNAASGLPVLDASSLLALTQQRLNFKIGFFTRDMTTASGNQAITGVGFTPRMVIFFATRNVTAGEMSIGVDDGTTKIYMADYYNGIANSYITSNTGSIMMSEAGGLAYTGNINSLDADGFTIAWARGGAKTGTVTVNYIALR